MFGRDGIAGLICLGVSLVLLVLSLRLPQMPLVPVGPGFWPQIVLVGMMLLSATLVVNDWRARRMATPSAAPADARRPAYGLVLQSFIVFGIYVALMPLLGYRIATVLFVAALQALLEPPATPRGWLWLAIIALGTSAMTYLAFERYLSVLLPRGTWTGW
jgi:hypothetical protein